MGFIGNPRLMLIEPQKLDSILAVVKPREYGHRPSLAYNLPPAKLIKNPQ
jgi:hypothetical protein